MSRNLFQISSPKRACNNDRNGSRVSQAPRKTCVNFPGILSKKKMRKLQNTEMSRFLMFNHKDSVLIYKMSI